MRSFELASFVFGLSVAVAGGARAQTQSNYGQQPGTQAGYQQQPGTQAGYQQQPGTQAGYQQQPGTQAGYQQPYQVSPSSSRKRGDAEMGTLYVTGAAYGVGLGVWASTEMGLGNDPGLFLLAPVALGVAAPVGAFFLDSSTMKRGQPMAISAGLMLGAGEGLGIWGTQRVTAKAKNAWGFRGLARSAAIGSTIGGVGGYLAGEFMEPPSTTSILAVSGAFWGTAIGSMFGYGSTDAIGWGQANDRTAVGGLVGYNVGMVAAGGLGALLVPAETQLVWMWGGAGIGAAASLPVFLLYAGEGGPPARRGFIFMGTATTLGIIAGGVFGSGSVKVGAKQPDSYLAKGTVGRIGRIEALVPTIAPDHLGLTLFGSLE